MKDKACDRTPLCLGWDWGRIQLLLWLLQPPLHSPRGDPLVCPSSVHRAVVFIPAIRLRSNLLPKINAALSS